MTDGNCIFCKIAAGEIPSRTIRETEEFRVVLDVAPATKGHALILPKNHYRNLLDLPQEMAQKAMVLAKETALSMKESLGCDGINLVQNNEEAAGQTVFHFHLHVIPRYEKDEQKIVWTPREFSLEEMDEIADKLKR